MTLPFKWLLGKSQQSASLGNETPFKSLLLKSSDHSKHIKKRHSSLPSLQAETVWRAPGSWATPYFPWLQTAFAAGKQANLHPDRKVF